VISGDMSKREYASAKAIAKQLKEKTGNKPVISNTKKTKVLNMEFTF
jgi:hypothetical protein